MATTINPSDQTITQYNVQTGGASNLLNNVAPSATSGVPLISQGAASQPIFGTLPIVGGGTASTSFNTNGVVISGTGSTSALTALSLTDGQIVIGSSIGVPTASTITAGSGITVTNGHNTITIAASGSALIQTITGNTGGALSPTAGNFNILGTGSITIAGAGSTETVQLTGLNQYNVLLGQGNATVGLVAPSATSGIPLISQGAAANPVYGTAVVAGGGTGDTSFTAYSVITGGTTSTGALQNVSGVGTSGQVLSSNGAGALPSWQTPTVALQVILSTGTYTPTTGMLFCFVEIVGGGGAGGGALATNGSTFSVGGGGAGGAYSASMFSAATIGVSQSVTIGAGGTLGAAGADGNAGGDSSFGALLTAPGGNGGGGNSSGLTAAGVGGQGHVATGGSINIRGQRGNYGFASVASSLIILGSGGNSIFGFSGQNSVFGTGSAITFTATGYGSGGGGGGNSTSQSATTGAVGMPGICKITEYIIP